MEEQNDMSKLLEMIAQPAFCVNNGLISMVNHSARQMLIDVGSPIAPLIGNAAEEYAAFENGCLCLTLKLADCPHQASVTRLEEFDLFVIDQAAEQTELRAMSLTALTLREPLSDLMMIYNQILPTLDTSNPTAQAQVCRIQRRLNQLHRIVCNMSDAVKYAGNSPPRMTCQDVCAVVSEIIDHAEVLVTASGYQMTYTGPRTPVYGMICVERLERAIYNMLSNAMKFADPGSQIKVKLTHSKGKLYLSVQDDGKGIPSSMIGSVYSRYRRQPGLEDPLSGLGLGMVLVRGAAYAHDGSVLITQPSGSGTKVVLTMTVRQNKDSIVRTSSINIDYAGERDHGLLELSDVVPEEYYSKI